tara:strand:- start:51 stop:275 length:225 start_codon:yes stop_codon:yes gene_type:complete
MEEDEILGKYIDGSGDCARYFNNHTSEERRRGTALRRCCSVLRKWTLKVRQFTLVIVLMIIPTQVKNKIESNTN